MQHIFYLIFPALILLGCMYTHNNNEGWQSLFDGHSLSGWHKYGGDMVGKSWKVESGVLFLDAGQKNGWQTKDGGDIVTDKEFENFHLRLEWKISQNGNSGILFYVHEDTSIYKAPYESGLEMQILDNDGHPDGKIHKHRTGDLYDLIPCSRETVNAVGEWNQVEIICDRGLMTFMLNGTKVVETTLWNEAWETMVAESKFSKWPGFGSYKKGRICLQDHGDKVWFRNIEIRKL